MVSDSLVVDSGELDWRPTPCEGVAWKKLRHDSDSGASAVLLRFEAGASYDSHRHPAGEEYWVIEGNLTDGGRTYGPGTYVYHAPGSVHRPASPDGCIVLVWLPRPIEAPGAVE